MIDKILAKRNSFPSSVNRAIDYVADHPMGALGRIVARRMGTPAADDATPVLTGDTSREIRVLIGPVNYSAQGRLWAKALADADERVQALNLAMDVPGGFDFDADLVVPVPVYHNGRRWQAEQLAAASTFTHVLIEAEEPLFGRLLERDVAREATVLGQRGVNVAFIAHGTDIRIPSGHRERTPWSPYRDPALYVDRLERLARRHRDLVEGSGRPVFVSTPDLLADVPLAAWCPVVVDPAAWATPATPAHDGPLRVVHVPSSVLIKGTHLIEPMLRSLHERGVIDYHPISGVPSSRMSDVFAAADVVLDQFRLGSYGVAACEAMAAGRLVMGHVLPAVRAHVEEAAGRALPVVEATPDTLESELLRVAGQRELLASARSEGMAFVSAVHDGRLSARVLLDHWIDPPAVS